MTWRREPQYLPAWHKAPEFTINGKEENCVKLCFLNDARENGQSRAGFTSQLLLLIEIYWRFSQSMPSGSARFQAEWTPVGRLGSAPALKRGRVRTQKPNSEPY
jgi:hypothetical protein